MTLIIPKEDLAFVPLVLPKDGESLLPGRQYRIDSVARAVIINNYGLRVPVYVECLRAKCPARRITTTVEYLDGRPAKTTSYEEPAQEATFRAFFKHRQISCFTLDLTVVEFQRQFYQDAPVEPDEDGEPERKHHAKVERTRVPRISTEELLAL